MISVLDNLRWSLRPVLRAIDSLAFRARRRWLSRALGLGFKALAYLSLAVALGLSSAWYAVTVGTPMTVQRSGPWAVWPGSAAPEADPYTRAHLARLAALPLAGPVGRTYFATSDSAGSRLYADCEYDIAGEGMTDDWWALGAFDTLGNLFESSTGRYSVNSATLLREVNGSFRIRIAREARPGNWIPVDGEGGLVLALQTIHRSSRTEASSFAAAAAELPRITRVSCR